MIDKQVLEDINLERKRQDQMWGEQNHNPLGWLAILVEEVGEYAEEATHYLLDGTITDNMRVELVQVAAVAIEMIESLDRNSNKKK